MYAKEKLIINVFEQLSSILGNNNASLLPSLKNHTIQKIQPKKKVLDKRPKHIKQKEKKNVVNIISPENW